ncbi:MAG: DUF547 domain-containing protein [Spirochaetes bacterium]|jgi:hypothetical protein|nr:DUF547 domain-containing protein [Spirochaetota bacterium]
MRRALLIVTLFLIFASTTLFAAPQAELWPRWSSHDPSSTRTVDHGAWGSFLDEYLLTDTESGVNLIPYGDVREQDAEALDRYLEQLQDVPVSSLNRAEQRAFWINLYNAYTVKVVLDHYPVASIRDIDISGLFSNGPWDAELMSVEGVGVTLNDIEHRILRPIYQDPRIHYAVNCASIGCPNLQPEPFTADNYERLVDRGAASYINHPRGVGTSSEPIVLSSIYEWFTEDFGGSFERMVDHLVQYAQPELAAFLRDYEGSVDYAYDWSLNEP